MKTNSLLLCSAILLAFTFQSCNKQYGEFKIKNNLSDTLNARLRINEIRNIDNNIFKAHTFEGKQTPTIKYRLLKPEEQTDNKKFPLVIVFHGSNAVGTDNNSQLGALAKLWAMPEIKSKYPAYILAPQFPTRSSNYQLDENRNVLASIPQPALQTSLQLIDSLKKTLNIDETRIYVIGFSMGASSVINVLSARPELFAAGVSISGIPQFDQVKTLSKIPLWLIHGDLDTENPFNGDLQFFKELDKTNKTRFWLFESKAHNDIFTSLILGENIPKWLFQHKR